MSRQASGLCVELLVDLDCLGKVGGVNSVDHELSVLSLAVADSNLDVKEGAELIYSDDANELSFVFTNGSMTVKANKGSDYSAFEGFYERKEQAISTEEAIAPKDGSALELLGRTALTYYMLEADGLLDCMIQPSLIEYNNKFMVDFLLAYTDLFLVSKAELSETIYDG